MPYAARASFHVLQNQVCVYEIFPQEVGSAKRIGTSNPMHHAKAIGWLCSQLILSARYLQLGFVHMMKCALESLEPVPQFLARNLSVRSVKQVINEVDSSASLTLAFIGSGSAEDNREDIVLSGLDV